MTPDRRMAIAHLLTATRSSVPLGIRLASATRSVLAAEFVGLTITSDGILTPVELADDTGLLLDEQQFNLGDGPTFAAAHATAPVVAADLDDPPDPGAWPLFRPVATAVGVRSIVALPLAAGTARLGVLTAYRPLPGAPDAAQFADALVLAELTTELLLVEQAGAGEEAVTGSVAEGLERHAAVHQAAGMLSEQLNISIVEALVRLRAHAAAVGQPLHLVGRSILSGELKLER